jgi:hypothetical protein
MVAGASLDAAASVAVTQSLFSGRPKADLAKFRTTLLRGKPASGGLIGRVGTL